MMERNEKSTYRLLVSFYCLSINIAVMRCQSRKYIAAVFWAFLKHGTRVKIDRLESDS